MKLLDISTERVIIEFSINEIQLITNALNEVCSEIEDWEFDTRLGASIEKAKRILKDLNSFLGE